MIELQSQQGRSTPAFSHQPALDGLRAVAVVLVLLFHAGVPMLGAGYLGVSVFFTLSGYLITSLLLREHERTGTVAVGEFYARRIRRLLPASMLCIALVIVARGLGAFARVEGFRRDVVGALLQVYNWVALADGGSYADLFLGGTSPLEHYWSLAIEEQFYWIWPAAVLLILRLAGARRTGIVIVSLFVSSAIGAVVIARHFGKEAAYWATPARLPEILAGAVLAAALVRRPAVHPRARWLAIPSLGLVIWFSTQWPVGSGPAYAGALPLFSLLSATLIFSLQVPGPVRTLLSVRVLVGIGQVSYGLYLFHWPIFVFLREQGWDLAQPPGLAVALMSTAALALLSYRFVEAPIRYSRPTGRRTWSYAATATVVGLAATLILPLSVSPFGGDSARADRVAIVPVDSLAPLAPLAPSVGPPDADPTESVIELGDPPTRPVRILLLGDSTLQSLNVGLQAWAEEHPRYAQVSGIWAPGLTFLREGEITNEIVRDFAAQSAAVVDDALAQQVPALQPDVVVLMTSLSDVIDRRWPDIEGSIDPTDPRYGDRLSAAYDELTAGLLELGVAHVIWVVPPVPLAIPDDPDPVTPDRYRAQQEIIRRIALDRSGDGAGVIELEAWLDATGNLDRRWRPDGLHIADQVSPELAEQFLGPLLIKRAVAGA